MKYLGDKNYNLRASRVCEARAAKKKGIKMVTLLTVILFVWLLGKAIGLAVKLAWGAAKVIAGILMVLAVPLLIVCVVFAGGIALIIPIAVIGIAFGILKACV